MRGYNVRLSTVLGEERVAENFLEFSLKKK